MAKKKDDPGSQDTNPDDLNEEELAAEAEMMAEPEEAEVVAEEEAAGDEALSDETPPEEPAEAKEEPAKEEPPAQTTVPLGALDSERHKRKEAEAQNAVLQAQLQQLVQAKEEPPAEDKMPDPVIDQAAFEAWMDRRDAKLQQPVQAMTAQMTAQQQQMQQINDLRQFASAGEVTFRAENDDYGEALEHAQKMKGQEFRNYGFPEEQIPLLVAHAEASITALARERGVNPAAIVYEYAKMTGYKGKAPVENEGEKVARLAEAQKKTQSTSGAGGSAREEEWTPERLAGLSDEEMAKVPEDVMRRVMGG